MGGADFSQVSRVVRVNLSTGSRNVTVGVANLPGGWSIGDRVESTIKHSTIVPGSVGTALGPYNGSNPSYKATHILVNFPDMDGHLNINATSQLRKPSMDAWHVRALDAAMLAVCKGLANLAFTGRVIHDGGRSRSVKKKTFAASEVLADGTVTLRGGEKRAYEAWLANVQSRKFLAGVLHPAEGVQWFLSMEAETDGFESDDSDDGFSAIAYALPQAVQWTIMAIKVAPHNKAVKGLVRKLLGNKYFTGNLDLHNLWGTLYKGACEIMDQIGTLGLRPLFYQNNLGVYLSDQALGEYFTYHPTSPSVSGSRDQRKKKPSQRDVCPPFFELLEDLDYDDYAALPERQALVAFLLLSSLINAEFEKCIEALRTSLGSWCTGTVAPVKGFARALVKLYADYYKLASPRAQWVLDSLRCLLLGPNVVSLHAITAAISNHFGGFVQLKNPFALSEGERANRSHLLLINGTVVFDTKKTIGQLANGPAARGIFASFKADTLHGLPTSQWHNLVDAAIEFLCSGPLNKVPARLNAEIQFTLDAYGKCRDATHDAYDVQRAGKIGGAERLLTNFNSGGERDDEDMYEMHMDGGSEPTPDDLYEAALQNHPDLVQRFLDWGDFPVECEGHATAGIICTPLLIAAQLGHIEIVKLLLAHPPTQNAERLYLGIDFILTDYGGNRMNTALTTATMQGHLEIVKVLLEAGANPRVIGNGHTGTAREIAAKYGHSAIVVELDKAEAAWPAAADSTKFNPTFTVMEVCEWLEENHLQQYLWNFLPFGHLEVLTEDDEDAPFGHELLRFLGMNSEELRDEGLPYDSKHFDILRAAIPKAERPPSPAADKAVRTTKFNLAFTEDEVLNWLEENKMQEHSDMVENCGLDGRGLLELLEMDERELVEDAYFHGLGDTFDFSRLRAAIPEAPAQDPERLVGNPSNFLLGRQRMRRA